MRLPASRRRHFRSFVLWTVGLLALMQLTLGSLIDVALPKVRDPEYVHRENVLLRRLAEETGKPVVLVLGSSRVENGFDAQAANQVLANQALLFNFGIPTSGPLLEKVWLDRLEAQGVAPDLVLLEVIPANYTSAHTPPDLHSLDGARLSAGEMTRFPALLRSVPDTIGQWAAGRALPTHRHQAELRGAIRVDEHARGEGADEELLAIDHFGWRPRDPAQGFADLRRMAHRQYDEAFRDFKLSSAQADQFSRDIAACREHGIKTAVLLMPEGTEFRRMYTPEMTAAIDGMLAHLHEQFQVPIIDARDWMDDASFSDMHHLLPQGAKRFSRRLAREAIAPLLRERGAGWMEARAK